MRNPSFAILLWMALGQDATAVPTVSDGDRPFLCASEVATIHADFPGARAGDCTIQAPDRFSLTISPERAPPINSSPWYAFRLDRLQPVPVTVELRYLSGSHRYAPKLSVDGNDWQTVPAHAVETGLDDGGGFARFEVPAGIAWVAAQALISSVERRAWLDDFAKRHELAVRTIGHSHDGAQIAVLDTGPGPQRRGTLLILGGQHPPEVTGTLALHAFVESIFSDSRAARRFRARTRIVVAPLLNPDGVDRGHWRTNRGGVDLNRDWGTFSQPETRAIRDWIDAQADFTPTLVIDFHSTHRNLFYVQSETEPVRRPHLVPKWLALARRQVPAYAFDIVRTNENPGAGTSKNYFYKRYGNPAITYEVGDETSRDLVRQGARGLANALITVWR